MTVEILNKSIEKEILSSTGCHKVFWFGGGNTALYYAFKAIKQQKSDIQQPEIILPSILCTTPANVAIMAGLKPRFADIDIRTGLISLESAKNLKCDRTIAILAAHLLGNTINLTQFSSWCKKEDIVLIEDNAQSLGGILPDKKPVGYYGDYSVYSFNKTKILESGGGALLVRSSNDSKVVNSLIKKGFNDFSYEVFRQVSDSYRNLYHSMITLLRQRLINPSQSSELILSLTNIYNGLFLRSFRNDQLNNEWVNLNSNLQKRYEKAEMYKSLLSSLPLSFISEYKKSGVCWRYTVLYSKEEKLIDISETIRREGFHVSNLYWPINHFFNPSDNCPNAETFGKRVLNFWVDSSIDSLWIEKCCKSIRKNLR